MKKNYLLLLIVFFPLLIFSQVSISKVSFVVNDELRLGASEGEIVKFKIETSEAVTGGSISISGWGASIAAADMTTDTTQTLSYSYTVPEDISQTDGNIEIIFSLDSGAYTKTISFPIADTRKPSGGGSTYNPYEVSSVANLSWVFDSANPNNAVFFKQTKDLDLLGYTWESKVNFNKDNFSRDEYTLSNFNYDGGSYSINNIAMSETLVFDDLHSSNHGFFGRMNSGSVTNLTIDNAQFNLVNNYNVNLNRIGILAGHMNGTVLNKVTVKNSSINIYSKTYINRVGLVVGHVEYMGLVQNILSENNTLTIRGGDLSNDHYSSQIGGVFGQMSWNNNKNDISKIYSRNVVLDLSRYGSQVGGLIGNADYLFYYASNSGEPYSMNEVYAENFEIKITSDLSFENWQESSSIGGLLGYYNGNGNGPVKTPELERAYATGKIFVNRPNYVGGLIGNSNNLRIKNVYAKVDIVADFGELSEWQNGFDYNRIENLHLGGLFGNYEYDRFPLSNSYSASNIVLQYVGFDEDQIATRLNETKGRIGAIAGSFYGFEGEGMTNSVLYDDEVYTFNSGAIGNRHQEENPNIISNAVATATVDMKLISNYMKKSWDFVLETTNGTQDVWDIDNGGNAQAFNNGYPFFNYQIDSPLAQLPVIVSPNTDFSTGLVESRHVVTALSPAGGNVVFTASSNNTDIVTVAVENTLTEGNTTTAELVFTYTGNGSGENTAMISVLAENPIAESGSVDFNFIYDLINPEVKGINFYNGTQRRLGAKPGEVIKIIANLSEEAGPSKINISGWGTAIVEAEMTIDPEDSTVLYYNYEVPSDASKTEAKVNVEIIAADFSGNTSNYSSSLVVGKQRKPSGGGSSYNPYEVSSVANLSWVFDSANPNNAVFFKQTKDLDLLGYTWESKVNFNKDNFSRDEYTLSNFNYDGGSYSINNIAMSETLVFDDLHSSNHGFFGRMNSGSVTNLTIDNAQFNLVNNYNVNLNRIGILAGHMNGTVLNKVTVKNSSINIYSKTYINRVGLVVGHVEYMGLVQNILSENNTLTIRGGDLSNDHYSSQIGGVFGQMSWNNNKNDISKIYSRNVVLDLSRYGSQVGGLIGNADYLFYYASNSGEPYSMNEVYAENFEIKITSDLSFENWQESSSIGGLLGYYNGNGNGPVKTPELERAYATGKIFVNRPNYVGGLIGNSNNLRIKNVYAKVDIVADFGELSEWQNGFDYNRIENLHLGGLFGNYEYDRFPLSNSYSASNIVLQYVGFDEDQIATRLNETKGRIGAIAGSFYGFEGEGMTNSVLYDDEVYTFNSGAIGNRHQEENPNIISNAVATATVDMKSIEVYETTNYNISTDVSSPSPTIWGINVNLNEGYPYFNSNAANYYQPTIALTGAKTVFMEVGDIYQELGATAADYLGNDISADITIDTSLLDVTKAGDYSITYNVTDSDGVEASAKIRNIKVRTEDFFKPSITLIGSSSITIEKDTEFTDELASVQNYLGQDISYRLIVSGTLNVAEVGTYALYYDAEDTYGNNGVQQIRTITVVDTSIEQFRPIITLNGSRSVTVKVNTDYTELGAVATDYNGNDISSSLVVDATTVDTSVQGSYDVTYDVVDIEGYNALRVTRTVVVKEEAYFRPTITLIGDQNITLTVGQNYREFGVLATSYLGSDLSDEVIISGTVDTTKSGTNIVRYNLTDADGNVAIEISRVITVNVVEGEYEVPTVTLIGATAVEMEVGSIYIELGATAEDYLGNDLSDYIKIDDTNLDVYTVGSYYLIYSVIDNEGGVSKPTIRIVNVSEVLNTEDYTSDSISVFPNPTKDIITVNAPDYKSTEVYNILGKKLLTTTHQQFSLSSFGKGMYFLRVKNSENNYKLLKVIVD